MSLIIYLLEGIFRSLGFNESITPCLPCYEIYKKQGGWVNVPDDASFLPCVLSSYLPWWAWVKEEEEVGQLIQPVIMMSSIHSVSIRSLCPYSCATHLNILLHIICSITTRITIRKKEREMMTRFRWEEEDARQTLRKIKSGPSLPPSPSYRLIGLPSASNKNFSKFNVIRAILLGLRKVRHRYLKRGSARLPTCRVGGKGQDVESRAWVSRCLG